MSKDNPNAVETEMAEVQIRMTKEERELLLCTIASLAEDYMAAHGAVYPEDRRPIWHFIDHTAVKWGVVNPFRLNPDNAGNKESNAQEGQEQGQNQQG
jgi:hypothetical protein